MEGEGGEGVTDVELEPSGKHLHLQNWSPPRQEMVQHPVPLNTSIINDAKEVWGTTLEWGETQRLTLHINTS